MTAILDGAVGQKQLISTMTTRRADSGTHGRRARRHNAIHGACACGQEVKMRQKDCGYLLILSGKAEHGMRNNAKSTLREAKEPPLPDASPDYCGLESLLSLT